MLYFLSTELKFEAEYVKFVLSSKENKKRIIKLNTVISKPKKHSINQIYLNHLILTHAQVFPRSVALVLVVSLSPSIT